jgi:hypothetical protein
LAIGPTNLEKTHPDVPPLCLAAERGLGGESSKFKNRFSCCKRVKPGLIGTFMPSSVVKMKLSCRNNMFA